MTRKKSQTKRTRVRYVVLAAGLLMIFGITGLFVQRVLPFHRSAVSDKTVLRSLEGQKVEVDENEFISGHPARLVIPNSRIDLPVIDGTYNSSDGSWTLSNDKAHYATVTPLANNKTGNTFIYGHNNSNVFAGLNTLKIGDRAVVETKEGYAFHYVLRETKEVDPQDTRLLHYQGDSILTVQTCSGAWFQNRKLFMFDFVKVEALS